MQIFKIVMIKNNNYKHSEIADKILDTYFICLQ